MLKLSVQINSHSTLAEFTTTKDEFVKVFEILAKLKDDDPITFEVTDEGIHTRFMDPTHVTLLDLGIASNGFLKFETLSQISNHYFTVPNTKQTLKKIKALDQDTIKIWFTKDTLYIQDNKTQFKLANTDDQPSDQVLPMIEFDSILEINDLKAWQKEHKKLESLGFTHVQYKHRSNEIIITSVQDKDEIKITFDDAEQITKTIRNNDDSESMYSLEYLNPFLQSIDPAFKVELQYATRKPYLYHLTLNNYIRIDFWAAPRVEN